MINKKCLLEMMSDEILFNIIHMYDKFRDGKAQTGLERKQNFLFFTFYLYSTESIRL